MAPQNDDILRLRKPAHLILPSEKFATESTPTPSCRHVKLSHLEYLPYVGLSYGFASIIVPYVIAVYREDVPAWLPYISDACGDPPQGAIFSMGMCVTAVFFLMGVYLYYLILESQNTQKLKLVSFLGRLLVLSSIFMAIGLFGVATNPTGHLRRDGTWIVPILLPHIVGAGLFFGAGVTMMTLLTFTTYLVQKPNWFNRTFISRVILLTGAAVGGLMVLVGLPSVSSVEIMKPSPDHGRVYPPGVEISAFGEWTIVIVFMFFVATFINDFAKAKVTIMVDYD